MHTLFAKPPQGPAALAAARSRSMYAHGDAAAPLRAVLGMQTSALPSKESCMAVRTGPYSSTMHHAPDTPHAALCLPGPCGAKIVMSLPRAGGDAAAGPGAAGGAGDRSAAQRGRAAPGRRAAGAAAAGAAALPMARRARRAVMMSMALMAGRRVAGAAAADTAALRCAAGPAACCAWCCLRRADGHGWARRSTASAVAGALATSNLSCTHV